MFANRRSFAPLIFAAVQLRREIVRRQCQQRRQRRLLAALLLRLLPLQLATQLPDGAGRFELWPVFEVVW